MGLASPTESAELEQLAEQYPEVRAEIEANKYALLEYVLQFKQEPPTALREKVLGKLDDLGEIKSAERPAKVLQMLPSQSKSAARLMLAASWIGLAISLGGNIWLYQNWQNTHESLTQIIENQRNSDNKLATLRTQYQQVQSEMAILSEPANQIVALKGTKDFPDAQVMLYWNKQTKEVFLKVKNLPKPPTGKQYQLWLIDGDSVKDAGMIVLQNNEFVVCKMKTVSKANAFAITLEREGGVRKAEGMMYVLGGT
jgi:hypothetical protein